MKKTRSQRQLSQARLLSSTGLMALTACGGSGSGSDNPDNTGREGVAYKGLLQNFRVFVDANDNGQYDAGENFSLTDDQGLFVLQGGLNRVIHGQSTAETIDTSSGQVAQGLWAMAPPEATVITPFTTILVETNITELELRQALGFDVNLLHYNPFTSDNINTADARAVEHAAHQIANITRNLTAVGEGEGLGSRAAFDLASAAFNSVVTTHINSATGEALSLWGDDTIGAVLTAYRAGLVEAGHSTQTFDSLRDELGTSIDIINQRILAVADITSTEAEAVFGLPTDLYAEIKAAAVAIAAGNDNPGLSLDSWTTITSKVADNGYTPPPPPRTPALTINAPTAAFTVQSDIDATLMMTGGAVLGDLVAGNAFTLTTGAAVATGTLFARANGQTSAASAQTFTLGTAGNDTIDTSGAGARVDYIFGGDGDDALLGGDGDDALLGGAGADTLTGGSGADDLDGGAGNDTLNVDDRDTIDGGADDDTAAFTAAVTAANLADADLANVENVTVAGAFTFTFSSQTEALDITGNADGNTIVGGGNADTIAGGGGNDTITGGAGNDTLTGGAGDDQFTVDAGDDTITDLSTGDIVDVADGATVSATGVTAFTATADTQNLGSAAADFEIVAAAAGATVNMNLATVITAASDGFTLTGGAEVDVLTGSDGDDVITGGAGDDRIIGGAGADSLTGGTGDDTFEFDVGIASHIPSLDTLIDGGDGSDTMFVWRGDGVDLTLDDADFENVANMESLDVRHGGGSHPISVTPGAKASDAFANGITITQTNASTLTVNGSAFTKAITATGGAGADTLTGGAGNDTLTGGAGADTFNITSGSDTITDLGVGGADVVVVSNGATVTATVPEVDGVVLSWVATADTVNNGTFTISIEKLAGGVNLSNATGSNGFTVNLGNDSDEAIGSGMADTIVGGDGNDIITGGAGADTLTGGLGNDTFTLANVANVKATADNILDFTSTDNIAIQATAGGEFGTLHDSNGNAFDGAAAGVVATVNMAGNDGRLGAIPVSNVISINADTNDLSLGYANIGDLQDAVNVLPTNIRESNNPGGGQFDDGDELLITWFNTTDDAYEVGIITIAGGNGFDGADEGYEKLLEVDVVGGLTLAELAASIDFIA